MIAKDIQVALNGALAAQDHPHLDLSLDGLVKDAAACAALGARDFHVHPRADDGAETLEPNVMARWLRALRENLPHGTLSVSTGAWIGPLSQRLACIEAWTETPDFASVNFHEPGAEDVADALNAKGVSVEAGLWHAEGAARFLNYRNRRSCTRVLIEMPDREELHVEETLDAVFSALCPLATSFCVILHGEGQSAWPMISRAADRRLATRIGLEDTVLLPDGTGAGSNAELFTAALKAHAQVEQSELQ